MSFKLSKYHYLFQKRNRYYLYAPLTNSFAEIEDDVYKSLLLAESGSELNGDIDDETLADLRRMKVIDVNDEVELNKLKFTLLSRRFTYQRIMSEKKGTGQKECILFRDHVEDFLMLHLDYKLKMSEVQQ